VIPDSPALAWGTEALWQQLEPLLPGLSVEVVARAGSTNAVLLERARVRCGSGAGHIADDAMVRRSVESAAFGRRAIDLQPCLLVAEQQSAGRGRQGRAWQSSGSGASLTFSLGLPIAAADWSGLSLAVGVALCEALDPDASGPVGRRAARIGLKWPNDLWLLDGPDGGPRATGRKLGGILIETVSVGAQRLAVIGVGLNVRAFAAEALQTGFATLAEIDPPLTAPAALARVAAPLVLALLQFEREGFAAFAGRFEARDLLRGRQVHTTSAETPDGIARGVSPRGALLVEVPGGRIASISSGEVSVRPTA
jgi:BirA family transcriptional regulator, biotin operon repressor / biotin---[acetyl-CoA-carboxylase] ligase